MHRKLRIGLILAAVTAAFAIPGSGSASGDVGCDVTVPVAASLTPLVEGLTENQTICLRGGSYDFDSLSIYTPNVTITSYPGETATLRGQVRIERSASGAALENLVLDGPREDIFSPLIYADGAVLRNNEITNRHSSNCVHIARYYDEPAPRDVLIEGNRIHDCGRMPAANHDHGIYVAASRNLTIRDNVIYNNADRGIQLFPDAQGTRIEGNIIDGNGQGIIFSGYEGISSNDTTVVNNIITNSNVRHNVESFYPEDTPAGRNNVVHDNCIWNADGWYDGPDGSGIGPEEGFDAYDNIIADPGYDNRQAGDFDLRPGSPCAGVLDGAEEPKLSLEAVDPTVAPGQKTKLRGRVPVSVTSQIWIFKKKAGNWKAFKRASAHGSSFGVRVRIHRRSKFKARAAGLQDSEAVAVTARKSKH